MDKNDISEEIICGFRILPTRKKMWQCEIELLIILDTICKKNNIKYFLIFGAALGAVRHNGFIPWDDDIDIGMLRDDFEHFLVCDKSEFGEYIDIQYGISEHGIDSLLRIRDRRTTGIINTEIGKPGNKGIFIEVYPFDVCDNVLLYKLQMYASYQIQILTRCKIGQMQTKGLKGKIRCIIAHFFSADKLWLMYQRVCRMQNSGSSKYVSLICLPIYAKKFGALEIEFIKETVRHKFEYIEAEIPKEYDKYLSSTYGEYMILPEVQNRGMKHANIVFYDPDHPYEYYENSDIPIKYFEGNDELNLI